MSETGHVINVQNLKKCRDIATAWGPLKYKPSHADLDLVAMQTLIDSAEGALDDVQTKLTPYRTAVSNADDAFSTLSETIRRVERAAKAAGLSESFLEDLAIPARKVKGQRVSPTAPADPGVPGGGTPPTPPTPPTGPGTGSSSQMSRQQRIEHFDECVSLLASQPGYTPNEADLKVVTLQTESANLQSLVDGVSNTLAPLNNSRNARNEILYTSDSNVVNTGRLFKSYTQSAYGIKGPEWNQVKSFKFTDNSDQ